MFFLKLEGNDLERLLKLTADKKGTPVERLARLAFLKGLRLLAKADAETVAAEVSLEKRPYLRHKPLEEIQAHIRENWQQETDEQMGETLGYGEVRLRQIRLQMGLLRPKGRWGNSTSEGSAATAGAATTTTRQQRREQQDALIREHWETKNDAEIGRLMTPPRGRLTVMKRRLELGLERSRGSKREGVIREAIEPEEFERLVLREGYTMIEYIRLKNLPCGRERLRQVAQEMGLKHSPEDRSPEWELVRKARQAGNLNLANRQWLEPQVAAHQSMATLAAELGVDEYSLWFFIRAFGFTHPSFRKEGAKTVNLICATCGKEFTRLLRWHKQALKRKNGEQKQFFCSQSCVGKYANVIARQHRSASHADTH